MAKLKALAVVVALVFCAGCAAQKAAGPGCKPMVDVQKYTQKADNFLVLLDSSETMKGTIGGKAKLCIAKDAVRRMGQCIPADVKVVGGLRNFGHGFYLFSIFQTDLIYGMTDHSQDSLEAALCRVDAATGNTPMVKAINAAAGDLQGVQGRTALILVTDGKPTDGNAVTAVANLKKAMGENLCVYAVQVGDDIGNKRYLETIVKAGGCGFVTSAAKLAGCEAMTDFVERVIFNKCMYDEDLDEVCDKADKCPGTPRGAVITASGCIPAILFDYNMSNIKRSAAAQLDELANVLNAGENMGINIELKGYADNTGAERYNVTLGSKRAQAVKDYLIKRGVKSSRLAVRGYGEAPPVDTNDTAAGRANNRRVEFACQ